MDRTGGERDGVRGHAAPQRAKATQPPRRTAGPGGGGGPGGLAEICLLKIALTRSDGEAVRGGGRFKLAPPGRTGSTPKIWRSLTQAVE